ncbi:hypothetical protein DPMN_005371 [Dreissena polymorpha]|uniref:Palmitoyltransferase n=1 Tax=Dreissena polymorpha TaxID=45954 RepID=A0A9D4RWF3_DREPO|nr:hypothetical protein DPMN_005371 [Dreissena polymorpha]
MRWKFCEECDTLTPPRSHHCNYCRGCVLKRIHHCFITGSCVGFWNQRYFVVAAFYVMVSSSISFPFTLEYLCSAVYYDYESLEDLLLPVAIFKWILGYLPSLTCLLIVNAYTAIVLMYFGVLQFKTQIKLIARGLNTYEMNKSAPVECSNSFNANVKSVFGDFRH